MQVKAPTIVDDEFFLGTELRRRPRALALASILSLVVLAADLVPVSLHEIRGMPIDVRRWFLVTGAIAAFGVLSVWGGASREMFGLRLSPVGGWKRSARLVASSGAIFLASVGVIFLVLHWRGVLDLRSVAREARWWPLGLFSACVVVPIQEEIIYRLSFCVVSSALIGVRGAVLANGILFAELHVVYGNPSPENLLAGFLLSWAFLRSGSLIFPIVLHSVGNLLARVAVVGLGFAFPHQ